MKKNSSIVIFSGLLTLLALRAFGANPPTSDQGEQSIMRLAYMVLGVASLVTAVELWRGAMKTKLYVYWALAYLAVGGLGQFIIADAPVAEIVIWWLLVSALLFPVGIHLRHVLRQSV